MIKSVLFHETKLSAQVSNSYLLRGVMNMGLSFTANFYCIRVMHVFMLPGKMRCSFVPIIAIYVIF